MVTNKDPLITINLSRKQTLLFYEKYLIYKGQKINYFDIDGISYLWKRTKYSIYFIPTGSSSEFLIKIWAHGQLHAIKFSASSLFIGKSKSEKEKEEIFTQFYAIIENLIKSFLLINLLHKFSQEKVLIIDSLTITPRGLYRDRLWRKPEFLPWNQYYNSILQEGALHVLRKDEKKTYKKYFTCSMDTMNAVVVPDLLNFLFQKSGVIDEATKMELMKRKSELK